MVHTFNCLGRAFVLDVESGSVYEVDALTKKIIDEKISPAEVEGDFSGYTEKEIADCRSEVEELIAEGVLFSKGREYAKPVPTGVIKAMCLNISHLCNLRCEYCFADGGSYNDNTGNMSFEVAKAAIDFLIEKSGHRHNLEVDFFGGEPLLNFGVVKKTVEYARSIEKEKGKNFRFTITTNAMLLTDEITDYFNKEMYNVVVSVDGRKEVHDRVRKTAGGQGSYETVIKNALRFKDRRKGQYYIRGTYTSLNKDFASDVLYLNDLGFDSLSIEPVVLPSGSKLALKDEDFPALYKQYDFLAGEYYKRRKEGKPFTFFHFMIDLENGPCERKRLSGCGAGGEYVAISPTGDIYPCHQFDGKKDFKIGNVLTGEYNTEIPELFSTNNVLSKKGCPDCWAKYYCSGGCAANAVLFNGDINMPYKPACGLMKKRLECAIAVKSMETEDQKG